MATGVKGSDVYTSVDLDNELLALSVLLNRGVNSETVKDSVNNIIDSFNKLQLVDLLVLAFQTRDIRGGKGERDASRYIFEALLSNPATSKVTLDLLDLIPEYGCWQDLFKLHQASDRVKQIVKQQFQQDEQTVGVYNAVLAMKNPHEKVEKPNISLLAKWMPREGQPGADQFAFLLVPGKMLYWTRMKYYRKRVSALNKFLQTVEVKMCAKKFADIVPNAVPGRALKNYVNAFLNKDKKNNLRHPSDEDRMACRDHFEKHFAKISSGELNAKGADTLFPHEVVKKAWSLLSPKCTHYKSDNYICDYCEKNDERNHLRGVWRSMVDVAKAGGGLGRSIAMCDFSGSMMSGVSKDTPYWVSMALGLLISEVTTSEFKNTFLSFDSTPRFHRLPHGDLFTKLESFDPRTIGQGLSTDFQKAMDLVLAKCKEARVKPGEEPENLIVLTDMGWDSACSSSQVSSYTSNSYRNVVKTESWQTHVEMIRESFKRAGEDMWGVGWKMPTIVIWNISSSCQDFHAKADTPGVVMLSGWSPSLFKVLQTKGISEMTPEKALQIQLNDTRYDVVRQRFLQFITNKY